MVHKIQHFLEPQLRQAYVLDILCEQLLNRIQHELVNKADLIDCFASELEVEKRRILDSRAPQYFELPELSLQEYDEKFDFMTYRELLYNTILKNRDDSFSTAFRP